MSKQSRNILFSYLKCDDLAQKWQNVLDSFHHLDDGVIIKNINESEKIITLSDGSTISYAHDLDLSLYRLKTEGKVIKSINEADGTITLDDDSIYQVFNQFTEATADKLKALVYVPATATLSVDKPLFEKGVFTAFKFNWNVIPNEDIITEVLFDGSPVANSSNQTFTSSKTFSKQLRVTLESEETIIRSVTATEVVPQYIGLTSNDEPDYSYYGLSNFTKKLQTNNRHTYNGQITNQYLFFITRSSGLTAKDNKTGFSLKTGAWGDVTQFFWKKEIMIKLADGSDIIMFIYRTRQQLNQNVNISIL